MKLLAARDEVRPKLQAIMAEWAEEKRPVLRGEPISGSGAGKLDLVFGKILDVPMPSRVRWRTLFREMYDGTLDPEQAEIAKAHLESIRPFLAAAREALQQESCYLSPVNSYLIHMFPPAIAGRRESSRWPSSPPALNEILFPMEKVAC